MRCFVLVLSILCPLLVSAAELQDRGQPLQTNTPARQSHALVMGNGDYASIAKLANPVNDATSVGHKLESMGFHVTTVLNADRRRMMEALVKFADSAIHADIAVLFWAGHGLLLTGSVYLIPTDTVVGAGEDLESQLVSLESILHRFLPGRVRVVFFDSDIEDPRRQAQAIATDRLPRDVLISFAAGSDSPSQDSVQGSRNSPYTAALLDHLWDPVDISLILRKVRQKVIDATAGQQRPWDFVSLPIGELILAPR